MSESVASSDSFPAPELLTEMLSAPAPPVKKGGKPVKPIKAVKVKAKEAVAPVVAEEVIEEIVEVAPNTEVAIQTDEPVEDYKVMYEELLVKYNELLAKNVKAKHDNSPPEEGLHMRIVDGVKKKCRYIFPYQADGGKSIVKEMKDGQKCVGVSTTQKNNSKTSCKVADFNLIWTNAKTVKDIATGNVYPHKDGKFAVVVGETAFNVRMMVVAE